MKYFFLPILIFSLTICSAQLQLYKNYEPFVLKGNLVGRDTGYIIFWYPNTSDVWVRDTTYLKNGGFEFKGKVNQPNLVHLIGYQREGNWASFYLESGHQTITLKENKFQDFKMNGSHTQIQDDLLKTKMDEIELKYKPLSEEYEKTNLDFRMQKDSAQKKIIEIQLDELSRKLQVKTNETRKLKIEFISTHLDSYASPIELYSILDYIPLDSSVLLYNGLSAGIKNSRVGLVCFESLEKKKKNQVGTIVPDFGADDINGKRINLSQFRGKYVLLDFWASWCVPCRKAIPHLKEMYNEFHLKGFEIIAISVDKKKNDWLEAVKKDKTDVWINMLVNEEINKQFDALNMILPTQFLIDPTGRIVWNSNDENNGSWEHILKNHKITITD